MSKALTTEEWIKKAKEIHYDKNYDYSQSVYKGSAEYINIICPRHKLFSIVATNHISRKSICSKCANNILTQQEWLDIANKKHNHFYDYSLVNYLAVDKKVKIICPKHQITFEQRASSHLAGSGCKKCAYDKLSENMKVSQQEWILKANLIHNYFYDYSKVNYIGCGFEVNIICPKHGSFWQVASTHVEKKASCPECSKSCLSQQEWLDRANKAHNFKFDYSLINYTASYNKVIIKCPKHGLFSMNPSSHVSQKYGCSKCADEANSIARQFKWEDWLKLANEYHKNKYDYSDSVYTNYYDFIKIKCPIHGFFEQRAKNHLRGGCKNCARMSSYKERDWLDQQGVPNSTLHRNVYFSVGNRHFCADGFFQKEKVVYEFLGDFWHGHPIKFNPNDFNDVNKQKFSYLFEKTVEKIKFLRANGYKVICIWESIYDKRL